jgi:hypothetical protein
MKKIKLILGLSVITILFVIACSKDETITIIKTQKLKFENIANGKINKNPTFSSYIVNMNSNNQLYIDDDNLIIDKAVNKETGMKSYVIFLKNSTTLKSLQISAKSESESESGNGSITYGYWYDGSDCFIYGTIFTADDGTRLFVPADLGTQCLMNNCGWSNVA